MATDDRVPAPVRLVGRYQVVEEIGRGAMGIVYRGFDPVIGRAVALKTIIVGTIAEDAEEFRQRLFREAAAAGALAHPNIVTIHDVVHESGTTAVAMEFVEGETLAATIARRAPLPINEALSLMEQICSGLDYAAARGIVHRDIKPANILVGTDGRPRIADFGIARLPMSNFTMSGAVLGSAGYMSPEQVRGQPLDARSDLFSAATVFYEMLTGRNPFGGTEGANTMYRIVHEPPTPLRELNATLPPALDAVMNRALAKDPAGRFATGAELTRALRAAAGGGPGRAARSSSKAPWLLVGVAGLLGAIGFSYVVWSRSAPSAGPAQPQPTETSAVAPAVGAAPSTTLTRDAKTNPPAAPTEPAPAARRPANTTGAPPGKTPTPPSRSAEPRPAPATDVAMAAPPTTALPAPPPMPPAPPVPATVTVQFQGAPYPVTIFDGDEQIAQVSGADQLRLSPGSHRIRVVNDAVFLNRTLATLTLGAGEQAAITVPAIGSAVASVKGESYAGVRIFLDERPLPLPYPAQIPRLAGGSHTIRFAWISGALAGKELTQALELRGGGHVLIRAVPESDQVVVQQIR